MTRMIVGVIAVLSSIVSAQTDSVFEVASVKPRNPVNDLSVLSFTPAGGLDVRNLTLKVLIQHAYGLLDYQISGGPAWINSDKYDIRAIPKATQASNERTIVEIPTMLQTLLAGNFKLKFHRATNELPVYALTVALGSRMRRSKELTCTTFQWSRNDPPPNEPPVDHCGARYTGPNERLNHTLDAVGMSIAPVPGEHAVWMAPGNDLTTFLSRRGGLNYLVTDKTGLKGRFDFRLEWSDANSDSADEFMNPTIFAALEGQLGLKLELTKGPVEVFVIDHVERPDEN